MGNLFLDGSKLLYHLDVVERWLNKQPFFPIHVEISPSSACNQKCILCCIDYRGHKPQNLSREVMLSLVDDFKRCGVRSFLLAGEGEPLINKSIVEMVQRAKVAGVDCALNSNAVLLTKDITEGILDGLLWARFTFQSADPKRYAYIHRANENDFHKAVKNVKYAVEFKKKKSLKVTLGIQQILINENYDGVYDLAKLAKDIGVDYVTIKRFSKHPLNDYDVPEGLYLKSLNLFKKAEELSDDRFQTIIRWNQFTGQCVREYKRCIGLPFITQVLADGGIYPCCQYFGDDKMGFGNLNKNSFIEIWESDRRKSIIKYIENNVDPAGCMSYCRHHSTNLFLWQYIEKPAHINFI